MWNKNYVQFAFCHFLYFNKQHSLLQYTTLLIEYTGNTFSIYKKTTYNLYPPIFFCPTCTIKCGIQGEGPYNFLTFFRAAYPTLRVGVCAPYPLIRTLILTVFPSPYNNFKNFRAPYPLLRVGVCAPSPLIKPSPCIPHLRVCNKHLREI